MAEPNFFGAHVTSKGASPIESHVGMTLRITHAALNAAKDGARATLSISIDPEEGNKGGKPNTYALCTLTDKAPQSAIEVSIPSDISAKLVVSGNAQVDVIGYYDHDGHIDDFGSDAFGSDADEEGDEEESEDDEGPLVGSGKPTHPPAHAGKPTPKPAGKVAAQLQHEESDEEDEEEESEEDEGPPAKKGKGPTGAPTPSKPAGKPAPLQHKAPQGQQQAKGGQQQQQGGQKPAAKQGGGQQQGGNKPQGKQGGGHQQQQGGKPGGKQGQQQQGGNKPQGKQGGGKK